MHCREQKRSGAEHLFSHALDKIAPGKVGLHGEKCGIGLIMIAKLQGQDWRMITKTLKNVGASNQCRADWFKPKMIVEALTIAQDFRPERYTILKEEMMTPRKASKILQENRYNLADFFLRSFFFGFRFFLPEFVY